jgi:hypothetical protein
MTFLKNLMSGVSTPLAQYTFYTYLTLAFVMFVTAVMYTNIALAVFISVFNLLLSYLLGYIVNCMIIGNCNSLATVVAVIYIALAIAQIVYIFTNGSKVLQLQEDVKMNKQYRRRPMF